jgi:hypothetical protein
LGAGHGDDAQEVPKTVTVAKQQPINCFTDLLRSEMAMAGFTEVLTFILGSTQDNFDTVNRSADVETAARISNAKTVDFEVRASHWDGLRIDAQLCARHPNAFVRTRWHARRLTFGPGRLGTTQA